MSAPVLAGPVLAGSVLAGPGLAGPVPADPVLSALLAGAAAALLVPGRVTPRAGRSPGAAVLLAGATGVVLLLGPPARVLVAAALLGLLAASAAWILRARRQASAARATAARVRESCESLAEELTAGAGPDRALARAARDWPSLGPVLAAHRVGLDVPTAWRRVAEAPGAGGLRLVAAAWQVSGRTGQGLAAALSRVAEDLRAGEASRRVVASELASARATGRLVAGLPVLAWLMGSGSGGDPLAWLLGGPAGWACLALGGGLLLGGLAWIELLAHRPHRPPVTVRHRPRPPTDVRRQRGVAAALAVVAGLTWGRDLLGPLLGPAVGLVAGAAVWTAAGRGESSEERRAAAQARTDLPYLVGLAADAVRAGSDPTRALRHAADALPGPTADRLLARTHALALGADPAAVWRELAHDPALAPLGRALARAHESGTPVADAVARLAVRSAEQARAEVEDRARRVGVRAAVPLGLCLLPSFVVLGIVPLAAALLADLW